MQDEELIQGLRALGIDARSHMVIALLPLVQVAWADGEVQDAERALIEGIADQRAMLEGDGTRILMNWLTHPPTEEYLVRGRQLLVELARRDREIGEDLTLQTLEEVLDFCEQVARAAGGLFGVLWSVDDRERQAIREIARALDIGDDEGLTWGTLERSVD